jgi:hypothetical protein
MPEANGRLEISSVTTGSFRNPGESRLKVLLQNMQPSLSHGEYVFCTFADASYGDYAELEPIASVQERQSMTLVVPRASADAIDFRYGASYRSITFGIHSSLESVGLTASVTQHLAERGISVNVIAGYFQDHLFVPSDRAEEAVEALEELSLNAL